MCEDVFGENLRCALIDTVSCRVTSREWKSPIETISSVGAYECQCGNVCLVSSAELVSSHTSLNITRLRIISRNFLRIFLFSPIYIVDHVHILPHC